MNTFVIRVGTYIEPIGKKAIQAARKIGTVHADVGTLTARFQT
jgi:hypothetical protein